MSRKRKPRPDPTHQGPWPVGSTLVYANGERNRIVNYPKINGEPGICLDVKNALSFGERFKYLREVYALVREGVWKVEPPKVKA